MSNSSSRAVSTLQSYRLLLYRRSVHPEFFEILDRRVHSSEQFEFESWLTRGAHMLRFQVGTQSIVEIVTPEERAMPDSGLATSFPCAGERDFEKDFEGRINYMTAVQTETISDNLYKSTFDDMLEFAQSDKDMQWCRWHDEDTRVDNLSIVATQNFRREVHAQTWHLDAAAGLVLRTQVIFEIMK